MNNKRIGLRENQQFYDQVYGIDIPDMDISEVSDHQHQIIKTKKISTSAVCAMMDKKFGIDVDGPKGCCSLRLTGGLPHLKKTKDTPPYTVFGFNCITNFKTISNEQRKYFVVQGGIKFIGQITKYLTFFDCMILIQMGLYFNDETLFGLPKEATIVTSQTNSAGNLILMEPLNKSTKIRLLARSVNHFGENYLFPPKREIVISPVLCC